ncbi:MAG TPA: SIS domain-containing protein [Anaerolineaceae bacterium]
MELTYVRDILDQPHALSETLAGLENTRLPPSFLAEYQAGRWQRIVLTGMGSSHYVLLPLYRRLIADGKSAWLVETAELLYSTPALLTKDTLLVVASQSGESAEIVRLMENAGSQLTSIAITNTPGSRLAQRAMHTILTLAGEEGAVSCKTYITALAAQTWLGDQLIGGHPEFPLLAGVPTLVQKYLAHWQEYVSLLKHILQGVRHVIYTGRGDSLAAAWEAGLTTKEATLLPAEGMSSAAFRHGPEEMTGSELFVVVFEGTGAGVALNRKLAEEVKALGGRSALVRRGDAIDPFCLPDVPDPALPMLETLPFQMMTLALAEMNGVRPGEFRHGGKVTATE